MNEKLGSVIQEANANLSETLARDYDALGTQLGRRGINIEKITEIVGKYSVSIPSWGVGTGGTRFARFPGKGEPRNVFEKIEDCGVIHKLTGATPTVSLHIPWDKTDDYDELRRFAGSFGLRFDSVNSNTFQDHSNREFSYKYGSLTHTDKKVREQAVEENIECIRIGQTLGAQSLTLWIGDGANFPGQQHFGRAFDRYLYSASCIYSALPDNWKLLIEYKMYEPALYATVIQDWGTALIAAQTLGPKACCLIDLGHHAPNVNIEMIVARLIHARRLGGFHFNDSKYGDDDLDAGSIQPYRLFLIFNELVDVAWRQIADFNPAYMLDQSHNVTDPIESLIVSAMELTRAYAQALLVNRNALAEHQQSNDVLLAGQTLREAFATDVTPILAMARLRAGAAIDPIRVFRASAYRERTAKTRPLTQRTSTGGIV